MQIVPFGQAHIDGAVRLFAGRLQDSPVNRLLQDNRCTPQYWRPWIEWLCGAGEGIALMDGSHMSGYMLGLPIDTFLGPAPGIYCPEYGHGAVNGELYPLLYRAAAEKWVVAGCLTHAISVLADDQRVQDMLFWQGFGMHVADAIMPIGSLSKPEETVDGVRIRPARREDGPALNRLLFRYWVHLKGSPVFLNWDDMEDIGDWTDREGHFGMVAEDTAGIQGYMLARPPGDDSSSLVQGEGVIGIGGAYVDQGLRGHHVARRLLEALLREGSDRGYSHCAVDFEAGNIEARRFWLKYFTPVSLSLLRRVPPII